MKHPRHGPHPPTADYLVERALLEVSRFQREQDALHDIVACLADDPIEALPQEVTTMDKAKAIVRHESMHKLMQHHYNQGGHEPEEILNEPASYPVTEVVEAKWWAVAIYECDRFYGGPEEGGWYYDGGELYTGVAPIVCINEAEIEAARLTLEARIESDELNKGRYSPGSVLSHGYYQVQTFMECLPPHFPQQRPTYE